MVWIHGGAYQTGCTAEKEFDGSALARRGVVVVFRRLPAQWFGFLAHNRLREEAEARHDDEPYANFYSDAYRTAGNIGLDCLWNGVVPDLCDANARLQRFFLEHDRTCVYAVDGTPVDETVLHPVGFIATTAEGSLAAMHSQEPDALDNAIRWVRLLWDTPIRTGTRRYYDNFLYAFAFLALAGEYRVW